MKKILLSLILFNSFAFAQVGIGNTNPKTALDVTGGISLREGIPLSLSNGVNNNIALGTNPNSFYRIIGPTSAFSITSIIPLIGSDGQIITLENTTTQNLTIVHDSALGTSSNRIYCSNSTDIILYGQYSTITLSYNLSQNRWIVVGNTANNIRQKSTTYFSTAGLATNGTLTYVPGFPTGNILIPENSDVLITADIGVMTNAAGANGTSSIDVILIVDGLPSTNSGYQRININNNNNSSNSILYSSISQTVSLAAGNHTFGISASTFSGSNSIVGGNNSSVLQGELTITIIKR